MKVYTADKIFASADFPLACSLAPQHESMVPHRHDFMEIVLVTRGCTVHTFGLDDGKGQAGSSGIIRGNLFSILPGEVHSYHSSHGFEIYNMALQPSLLQEEWPTLLKIDGCRKLLVHSDDAPFRPLYLPPALRTEIMALFHVMHLNKQPQDDLKRLEQKVLLLRFLLSLQDLKYHYMPSDNAIEKSNFLAALDRIEQMPMANDSLEALAKIACMSVSSFTAHFRATLGLSTGEYRQALRLDMAYNLLVHSTKSLDEIATKAGFYDSNYFIKVFSKRYGVSPGKLRKQLLKAAGWK